MVNLVQKAGQWNVDGVLKKQEKAQPVFYGRVLVQDGRVDVRTETTRESFIILFALLLNAAVWQGS